MLKAIKLLMSIALVYIILRNVDVSRIIAQFESANIYWILIVFLIMLIQFPMSAWKWGIALSIHNLKYTFLFLQKVLCIGFFFNNFLPTSIGGDGYRVIKTMPDQGFKSRSLSAVLLERILGLLAIILLGFFFGLSLIGDYNSIIINYFDDERVNYYLLACILSAVLIILVFLRSGIVNKVYKKLENNSKIIAIVHNYAHIAKNKYKLLCLIIISLLFQALAICTLYGLFQAMGVNADYAECAVISAVAGVFSILPISINGIGVVEGGMVLAASQLGLDYEASVAVAFILRVMVIPLSLICGIIYAIDSGKKETAKSVT